METLTGKNHGRKEELYYNSLITGGIMIWKERIEFEFSGFAPSSLRENIYLFSIELLDCRSMIVGDIYTFHTL